MTFLHGTRFRALALSLAAASAPAVAQDNILVIIADDVGVDRVGVYDEHPSPGNTPNIDALAANGLLFRNAYAHPSCSPTRSALLTGRYSFRSGLYGPLSSADDYGLLEEEITIPEMLDLGTSTYNCLAFGKWHLAGELQSGDHPLTVGGFDHHAGSRANLTGETYYDWTKLVNGVSENSTTYATTDTVNDAIAGLAAAPEPWFAWVAFNAPHTPYHVPPAHLHSFELGGPPHATPIEHMKAATEALDTELGRLLANIDPDVLTRTTIIFLGDNGTEGAATTPPFDPTRAKGTPFEGGINVPFIVTGPHVAQPGTEASALISVVDVFATIADIAGIDLGTQLPPNHVLDSISFTELLGNPAAFNKRKWMFSESRTTNTPGPYARDERAIIAAGFKIVRRDSTSVPAFWEFYDLTNDPFEQNNLLPMSGLTPTQARLFRQLYTYMSELQPL